MKRLAGHQNQSFPLIYQELAQYCDEHKFEKDHYGKGEVLNQFEDKLSEVFGMESALFLPSGVMAQLIAIKVWGQRVNKKTFSCHESCHLIKHEEDAYKHLLNMDVELLGSKGIVPRLEDVKKLSEDVSSLVYELPMRHLGGDLPTFQELELIKIYCQDSNIKFHIDGARIFESCDYYRKSVKEIAAGADSLFLSFYKGFGSTSGSMLFGSKDFIDEARIWLRRFGGNLFQLYALSLPAQLNFEKRKDHFPQWVAKAKQVAKALKIHLDLQIFPTNPKTNMFHVLIPQSMERLKQQKEVNGVKVNLGYWEEISTGLTRAEFTIGEATLELSEEEIVNIFRCLGQK